jgi:heptosyltransferase-2
MKVKSPSTEGFARGETGGNLIDSTERRPRLLVIELWGVGDLVIATPFIQAASKRYDVTVLAKPYAKELQARLWPAANVYPFIAPWTAFTRKYHLWRWPWLKISRLLALRRQNFDIGLSGRWDPRDHFLLWALNARRRIGFPRVGSQLSLTEPVQRPAPTAHRYEYWRILGRCFGFDLPDPGACYALRANRPRKLIVHSGAGQRVRVWPLVKYRNIARRLRELGFAVTVACDTDQKSWWVDVGETAVSAPRSLNELMALLDASGAFIGNDSGPAHLAAACGLPTFTIFGPQLPEWFAPLGSGSAWEEGKPCPYKPCSDYCRFPLPYCIANVSEAEVWGRIQSFLKNVEVDVRPAYPGSTA